MRLHELHPVAGDAELTRDDATHTYLWKGTPVPLSVTTLLKQFFVDEFDGPAVAEKYYYKWKSNQSHKYYGLIQYLLLVQGLDDEAAKAQIAELWTSIGASASANGTRLHARLEAVLDGDLSANDAAYEAEAIEVVNETYSLIPFRTELKVVGLCNGAPVVAGTIDYVARNADGDFVLIDWKRRSPQKSLLGTEHPSRFDTQAYGPFSALSNIDAHKYSAQLSVYACILESYGYRIASMLVVQLHESDLPLPHVYPAIDLRNTVRKVLEIDSYAAATA
jgi:hypothetical protein